MKRGKPGYIIIQFMYIPSDYVRIKYVNSELGTNNASPLTRLRFRYLFSALGYRF